MRPIVGGGDTADMGGQVGCGAMDMVAGGSITRACCAGFTSMAALTLLRSNFRKWRTDGHFGADVGQKLFNLACLKDFDLDSSFLRFDYGNDVAMLDTIPWFDQPLD